MAALALAIAGCNQSDLGTGTGTTTTPSATGIWGGTDPATGLSVIGYIDSTGKAVFVRGGVQLARC